MKCLMLKSIARSTLLWILSLTHIPTDGGVWSQALSSQDVSVNDILNICEIYQIGPITGENEDKIK